MCFREGDAVCQFLLRLNRVFGFEIKSLNILRFGGPGGTKKWVPPVWSEGTVGSAGKPQKELS